MMGIVDKNQNKLQRWIAEAGFVEPHVYITINSRTIELRNLPRILKKEIQRKSVSFMTPYPALSVA